MSMNIDDLILGESAAMRSLRDSIRKAASSSEPVCIEGPMWSGKTLVAYAIHLLSGRSGEFVRIHPGAMTDDEFNTFFAARVLGTTPRLEQLQVPKRRGPAPQPGVLSANDGTLHISHIGELTYDRQTVLSRILETRRIGTGNGSRRRKVNFRLITETTENLYPLLGKSTFRADLYFDMRAFVLRVPPLKERMEDLPILANHFARRAAETFGFEARELSEDALNALRAVKWEADVGELESFIRRAMLESEDGTLTPRVFGQVLELWSAV